MDSDITDAELYALVDGRGGSRACGPQTVDGPAYFEDFSHTS